MNILVTGGAGYIGSHVCKILKGKGFTPIVFDNLSRGFEESVKWGPLFIGDLRSQEKINEVFEKVKIGAVMHLGALAYVGESMENPHLYFENNVYGTLNLLETMKEKKVKKIIFSSTCAVYGSPEDIPVSEDTVISPESPYGTSKLLAESLINEYKNLGHIEPVIFNGTSDTYTTIIPPLKNREFTLTTWFNPSSINDLDTLLDVKDPNSANSLMIFS